MKPLRAWRSRTQGSLLAQALIANFVPVAVSVVAVVGLFTILFLFQMRAFEQELGLRAESLTRLLVREAELAAVLGDRAELERISRSALSVPDVLYVVACSPAGEVWVRVASPDLPAAALPGCSPPGKTAGEHTHRTLAAGGPPLIEVVWPIESGNGLPLADWDERGRSSHPVGVLRVGISAAKQRALLRGFLHSTVFLVLLALVLVLSAQRHQMRKVLAPLKRLIEVTRRVAGGDLSQRASVLRRDETGQLAVAFNEMAAALEQSRRELLAALEDAKQASRLKSEFLANMSHEIRTPLNAVIGLTELVLDSELPAEQRDHLTTAVSSAQSLLTLLNDILDLSKIEAGKLSLDCQPFALDDLLESVVKPMRVEARRKGLRLECHLEPATPLHLAGDPDRLRQVLSNLLSNALKFTREGRVRLSIAPEPPAEDEICLRFTVTDTGIGIPARQQQHIFEAFTQADGSTSREFGGTGLGLAICARLVQLMGGSIGVESEPGRGSAFHFTALFGKATEPEAATAASVPEQPRPAVASLCILLTEDNAVNQRVAVRLLEGQGHSVYVANDGIEALEALEQRSFDLILMDVQMPRLDGLEAARAIRRREQHSGGHIPIIAMTAHAMKGDRELCLEAGMDGYLTKPIIRAELLQTLAEVASGMHIPATPQP